jgi:hypothetical protein
MADLNALIAQGAQFAAPPDPFAQYGKMQQLRVGENQNALAQYQLESAKRTDLQQNALNEGYAQSIDPATGQINYGNLTKFLAGRGAGSQIPAVLKQQLEGRELQSKADKAESDLLDVKLKQSRGFLDTLDPADPNAPARYLAWHEANHADPIIGKALTARGVSAEQARQNIEAAIKKGPAAFAQLVNQSKLGTEKFIEMNKPSNVSQDAGGSSRILSIPGLGGPATIVAGSNVIKTGTIADQLAREKFAWEKSNPGYELKEDANGGMVAINKRTLEAVPVMVGGAAAPVSGAAAAPAVNIPQMIDPKQSSKKEPIDSTDIKKYADKFFKGDIKSAIEDLKKQGWVEKPVDGAAPAIVGPRTQLMGKGTALTESQSNAAMFGSAMAQAQQVLDKAQKEGTTTGAGTVNLAQGIVKYVPLGVGDKLVNDIYALAVNDPTKLFGPDVNQQKVGQAQLAFAIAYLRKTSGAAFGPSEVANTIMEYFPSVGEDQAVVKQKAESRKRAIAGMKMGAGREGAKFIEQYESPAAGKAGSSASDPLGLFPAKP